jgi:hypothetical protein
MASGGRIEQFGSGNWEVVHTPNPTVIGGFARFRGKPVDEWL